MTCLYACCVVGVIGPQIHCSALFGSRHDLVANPAILHCAHLQPRPSPLKADRGCFRPPHLQHHQTNLGSATNASISANNLPPRPDCFGRRAVSARKCFRITRKSFAPICIKCLLIWGYTHGTRISLTHEWAFEKRELQKGSKLVSEKHKNPI